MEYQPRFPPPPSLHHTADNDHFQTEYLVTIWMRHSIVETAEEEIPLDSYPKTKTIKPIVKALGDRFSYRSSSTIC